MKNRDKYGHFIKGHKHSSKMKLRLSRIRKGIKLSEETKKRISQSTKGRILSDVTKKRISIANSGKILPEWHKRIINRKGTHHSDKTKDKISKSQQGNKHYNWKGGKYTNKRGYVLVHSPRHPFRSKRGYVLEHRLVMEKHLKRFIKRHEVVHHKNHILTDNRIGNLELFNNQSEHIKYHSATP